ncbi:MAG: RNA 2',3'-cyclic phosphodiesterase [Methanoregula sp.]|jgi:2'-5' RNA ligase
MVRTFVALELSGEIREQLKEAQQVLRACSARLTFVDPPLIHITVKFLGEVDDKKLVQVQDALAKITFAPFPVSAGRVTVNNPKRPHTVWCAIDDGGRGEELLARVESVLTPLGFAPESRKFTAHATVARVKSPDPSLFAALDQLNGRHYGSCTVGGMKLKKSTLTPRGPVYEDLLGVKW